jgi:hypothetical protein
MTINRTSVKLHTSTTSLKENIMKIIVKTNKDHSHNVTYVFNATEDTGKFTPANNWNFSTLKDGTRKVTTRKGDYVDCMSAFDVAHNRSEWAKNVMGVTVDTLKV